MKALIYENGAEPGGTHVARCVVSSTGKAFARNFGEKQPPKHGDVTISFEVTGAVSSEAQRDALAQAIDAATASARRFLGIERAEDMPLFPTGTIVQVLPRRETEDPYHAMIIEYGKRIVIQYVNERMRVVERLLNDGDGLARVSDETGIEELACVLAEECLLDWRILEARPAFMEHRFLVRLIERAARSTNDMPDESARLLRLCLNELTEPEDIADAIAGMEEWGDDAEHFSLMSRLYKEETLAKLGMDDPVGHLFERSWQLANKTIWYGRNVPIEIRMRAFHCTGEREWFFLMEFAIRERNEALMRRIVSEVPAEAVVDRLQISSINGISDDLRLKLLEPIARDDAADQQEMLPDIAARCEGLDVFRRTLDLLVPEEPFLDAFWSKLEWDSPDLRNPFEKIAHLDEIWGIEHMPFLGELEDCLRDRCYGHPERKALLEKVEAAREAFVRGEASSKPS